MSHAERLRLALSRAAVKTASGPLHFTASFGVTVVGPETRVDAQTAISTADAAMYSAKHAGRNRVEFNVPSAAAVPA
jgi:diguanylate cyclase (GGDEF)-like protein